MGQTTIEYFYEMIGQTDDPCNLTMLQKIYRPSHKSSVLMGRGTDKMDFNIQVGNAVIKELNEYFYGV